MTKTQQAPAPWELGSEFHWQVPAKSAPAARRPWDGPQVWCGSGRDALCLLFQDRVRGLRRLWVPSYFCQDVIAPMRELDIELAVYRDDPRQPEIDLSSIGPRAGDAVLVVNTFGLRRRPEQVPDTVIIEDHSHDPWSDWARTSRATFAFVSLRKTLPVPDGAVLWSPRGSELPEWPALTPEHAKAAGNKLAAMLLKSRYLNGAPVDKAAFRELFTAGESEIAAGKVSAALGVTPALERVLPAETWRATRCSNWQHLRTRLGEQSWMRVLGSPAGDVCPFSMVLVFDYPGRREHTRRALIEERIYPAVLWPLEETVVEVGEAERALSRTILSLHCDARYAESDLDRVADAVLRIGAAWRA